jgi:hypothetical protein
MDLPLQMVKHGGAILYSQYRKIWQKSHFAERKINHLEPITA